MTDGFRILSGAMDEVNFPNNQLYDETKNDFNIIKKDLSDSGIKINYEEGNPQLIAQGSKGDCNVKIIIDLIQDEKEGVVFGDFEGRPIKANQYVEITRSNYPHKAVLKISFLLLKSELILFICQVQII